MAEEKMVPISLKMEERLRDALKREAAIRLVEGTQPQTYTELIRLACEELLERSDKARARRK